MSTTNEQAEIDSAVLALEKVAVNTKVVSGQLDAWLDAQGGNKKAAEVFLKYLSPEDEKQFVDFIKKRLPEAWGDKIFTLQAFMADKENGYHSQAFKDDLAKLKAENDEALKTGSLDKLQLPVGFERFFNGTATELVHSAHPKLEIRQRKKEGETEKTTFEENRVQVCIRVFNKFKKDEALSDEALSTEPLKTLLIDCGQLFVHLGSVESGFTKALQKSEGPKVEPRDGMKKDITGEIAALKESQVMPAVQNAKTGFEALCTKHPELSGIADTFRDTVSEPLQPAPPLVVHIPESLKSTFMEKVKQSGPKLNAALRVTAGAVVDKARVAASKLKTIGRFFSSLLERQSVKPVATEQNALPLANQTLVSETKESTESSALLAKRVVDVMHEDEKVLKETLKAEPANPAGPPFIKLQDAHNQGTRPSMRELAKPPTPQPQALGEPEPVKPPPEHINRKQALDWL